MSKNNNSRRNHNIAKAEELDPIMTASKKLFDLCQDLSKYAFVAVEDEVMKKTAQEYKEFLSTVIGKKNVEFLVKIADGIGEDDMCGTYCSIEDLYAIPHAAVVMGAKHPDYMENIYNIALRVKYRARWVESIDYVDEEDEKYGQLAGLDLEPSVGDIINF